MRIGIDIMGGDYAPEAIVMGSVDAQKELENDSIFMFGDRGAIIPVLEKNNVNPELFEIVHSSDVINMGEHPAKSFAGKPESSIVKGFSYLSSGKIDGFASAGNTGAMMVGAMHSVKVIPGIIRPCISSAFPLMNGGFAILVDVGINADCRPDVLYQYAILGSVYAESVYGIKNPRVGLLNIGTEPEKGNLLTKSAFELMQDTKDFNFIGNVEGHHIFSGDVDVIVTDGFTGNVVLKEAEAFYRLIKKRGIDDDYFNRFNFENYGGTPVLGINNTVVIGHGISKRKAIKNMIIHTGEIAGARINKKFKDRFK